MSAILSHRIASTSILLLLSILFLSPSLQCSAPRSASSPVTQIDEGSRVEGTGRLAMATSVCAPISPGPASWWPGDGDALDRAGTLDGERGPGAPYESAKVGKGFKINGTGTGVTVAEPSDDPPDGLTTLDVNPETGFTACFWMKSIADPAANVPYTVLDKGHASDPVTIAADPPASGWVFQGPAPSAVSGAGQISFSVGAGRVARNFPGVDGVTTVIGNGFHHVAGTWDPADKYVRLYVDGAQETIPEPMTPEDVPTSNDRSLNIGFVARPDGSRINHFNGIVDEVMIFPRALSQEEIKAIFDAGIAGLCPHERIGQVCDVKVIDCQRLVGDDVEPGAVFGTSAAIDGTRLILGAKEDGEGAAYIFEYDGSCWIQSGDKLIPFYTEPGDDLRFGRSVALMGDTAFVGAPKTNCGAGQSCGAVFVFKKQDGVWKEQEEKVVPSVQGRDLFGVSLAVDGKTLVVGADQKDCLAGLNCGAVYVFEFDDEGNWSETILTASSDADGSRVEDRFGVSVSVSGDFVVVGAPGDRCTPSGSSCGSVYVFERDVVGWSTGVRFRGSDTQKYDRFGSSVAMQGTRFAAGAYGGHGAAYVFDYNGSSWEQKGKVNAASGDRFGYSLALDGNRRVVGSILANCVSGDCGATHMYVHDGESWKDAARLSPDDLSLGAQFGHAVAIDGSWLVAGAPLQGCCGAAYVCHVTASQDCK